MTLINQIKTLEIKNINNDFLKGIDIKKEKKFLLAENKKMILMKKVFLSQK